MGCCSRPWCRLLLLTSCGCRLLLLRRLTRLLLGLSFGKLPIKLRPAILTSLGAGW